MTKKLFAGAAVGRRSLLGLGLTLTAGLAPLPLWAAIPGRSRSPVTSLTRALDFHNLHTGERLSVDYWTGRDYDPKALDQINHLLRDFRTDDVHPMDTRLLDVLYRLRTALGSNAEFEVVSAYRSPRTNAMLARNRNGVAKKSLHMRGMAIDVRLPGHDVAAIHKAAMSMRAGGVGLYRRARFVHLDVGRPRHW